MLLEAPYTLWRKPNALKFYEFLLYVILLCDFKFGVNARMTCCWWGWANGVSKCDMYVRFDVGAAVARSMQLHLEMYLRTEHIHITLRNVIFFIKFTKKNEYCYRKFYKNVFYFECEL